VSTDAPAPGPWGVLTARAWQEPDREGSLRVRVMLGVHRPDGTHTERSVVVDGWEDLLIVIRKWYDSIEEPPAD
jgi:hypothetical protein